MDIFSYNEKRLTHIKIKSAAINQAKNIGHILPLLRIKSMAKKAVMHDRLNGTNK